MANLVENLVLTEDRALEAARDADEVPCGGGVFESQSSRGQLGELAITERLEGDIQLDAVACVHDHDRVVALELVALGGERFARNAGDSARMGNEGHDCGGSRLDLRSGHFGCNRCQNGGRLRHGDHALPLVDAIWAISVSWPFINATNSWSMAWVAVTSKWVASAVSRPRRRDTWASWRR